MLPEGKPLTKAKKKEGKSYFLALWIIVHFGEAFCNSVIPL
jgi:hypothetical protein